VVTHRPREDSAYTSAVASPGSGARWEGGTKLRETFVAHKTTRNNTVNNVHVAATELPQLLSHNTTIGIERSSMYSLTFRVRVTTPRSMDEMERRTQQARPFYRRRGESSPACVVCECGMRAACGGPGGLPLGSATHFHSVVIATQPAHRLQIRPIVHN